MNIQKTSDAVSRPVKIVKTITPQELSCQRINLEPRGRFRENASVDGDMAF